MLHRSLARADILSRDVSFHTLRHSFACRSWRRTSTSRILSTFSGTVLRGRCSNATLTSRNRAKERRSQTILTRLGMFLATGLAEQRV